LLKGKIEPSSTLPTRAGRPRVLTIPVDWQHRAHFFAVSATMMRRILLDRARKRGAGKRGGKSPRVNLDDIP
jgi:hypothetical protein